MCLRELEDKMTEERTRFSQERQQWLDALRTLQGFPACSTPAPEPAHITARLDDGAAALLNAPVVGEKAGDSLMTHCVMSSLTL